MDIQQELFDYTKHSEAKLQWIDLADCRRHPLNPRLAFNEEQIDRIAEQVRMYGYKPEHAILVRSIDKYFEIVSGHHRVEACRRVGMEKILAWVNKDLSDEKAHSLLLLENDQSELSALEKGKHAYDHIQKFDSVGGRGMTGGVSDYAREHGLERIYVLRWIGAYKVVKTCTNGTGLENISYRVLYEISKSLRLAWKPLVKTAIDESWTVAQTKTVVSKINEIDIGDGYGYDLQEIFSKAAKNKARLSNQYRSLFERIRHWITEFDYTITLYTWIETDEIKQDGHQQLKKFVAESYEYEPKKEFITQVKANHNLKPKTIDGYAQPILDKIKANSKGGERWDPMLSDKEIARLRRIDFETEQQNFLDRCIKCGDAFQILPELPKKHFDALITDPPYGIDIADWDKVDAVDFTVRWVKLCLPLLKNKHHIMIFCSSRYSADIEMALREVIKTPLQSRLIWHKRNLAKGRVVETAFINTYDVILHYGNKNLCLSDEWTEDRFDVMQVAVPQSNFKDEKEHKTQKPLELLQRLISHTITEDDKVLDPFAGSGTTGVAVLQGKGYPTLIEQNGDYVTVARRRLQEELDGSI